MYFKRLTNLNSNMKIPKVLFQTIDSPIFEACLAFEAEIGNHDWDFRCFTEGGMFDFIFENSHPEFPNIAEKFNQLSVRQHRIDLFKYYFLYLRGGVYVSGATSLTFDLESTIESFGEECDLACVKVLTETPYIFDGFLAATPAHPAIKAALNDALDCPIDTFDLDVNYFPKSLLSFVNENSDKKKTSTHWLYGKHVQNAENSGGRCIVRDLRGRIVAKGYPRQSMAPRRFIEYSVESIGSTIALKTNEAYIRPSHEGGVFSENLFRELLKHFPEEGETVFLNIGAHAGGSALFFAKNTAPSVSIHSFEPQKTQFNLLEYNMKSNGHTSSRFFNHRAAVFCYDGKLNMNYLDIDGPHRGRSIVSLEEEDKGVNYGGICVGGGGEEIECVTLDNYEIPDNVKLVILCDAQGSEPYIFSAAKDKLHKYTPTIMCKTPDPFLGIIKSEYPKFSDNADFDVREYCMKNLGYKVCEQVVGSSFTLLKY